MRLSAGMAVLLLSGTLCLPGCIDNPLAHDLDGDGFMAGFDGDCSDEDATLGPRGLDADCDGVPTAEDCDDADADLRAIAEDNDCDGAVAAVDCDDSDAANFPGNADDGCDGLDTDCVPDGDEVDDDGDGQRECEGDCDDADELNFDGNVEVCDGQDNDCDGLDDAGAEGIGGQESDDDGDGQPECLGDCDDADASNFAGNVDAACDGLDSDCIDDPAEVDDDGDGQRECEGDCDDADATNFAGNVESSCDGIDTDCVYDGNEVDDDADGRPECQGDCDDTDPLNFGGNPEVCDGQDNDCNGLDDAGASGITAQESDADGDGQWECQGDCDDTDPLNFGGNPEVCDGQDNDCNGLDDAGSAGLAGQELDDDGDGERVCDGDCDDADASMCPGNWMDLTGDAIDSNCDGLDWFSLNGADAVFVGESGQDLAGRSVSSAGDVDGDGLDDLLIGAIGNDDGGSAAGKTYLFFGSTVVAAGTFNLSLADAAFVGENAGDTSGCSVSSAGDVDGDGKDDLLVGAYNNSDGGGSGGKTYLFLGSTVTTGGTFDLSLADAAFVGENGGDISGWSVSSAGDVDGDGLDDLLIGANNYSQTALLAGKTYLFFGSTVIVGGTFDLSVADASFVGENAYDSSARSVSSAGDVDGDGLADIVIGAILNGDGGSYAGKTYLFLGSTIAAGGSFDLGSADASLVGEEAYDYSGASVSSAGDVDGDGLDDLLIGAYGNGDGGSGAGKSYLFLGSTLAPGGTFDLSVADAAFVGENANDRSGASVSSAGDVDGDGINDLLIGADGNNEGGADAGKSYLFLGSTVTTGGTFNLGSPDAAFVGEGPDDLSGYSASSAGDVDGDGRDDLLISAYQNNDGGGYAGKIYLLLSPL